MRNFLLCIFILFSFIVHSQCTHTIRLTDTFGDGWNGGYVSVSVNGVTVLTNITLASGFGPLNYNFTASSGSTIRVFRTIAGSYPSEMRVQIVNNVGTVLLNTIQPVAGTATSGGQTCIGNCGVATPGCTNTSSYGSAVAPNTPTTVTISSCNFQSEYSTVSGIVAGQTYQFGYSLGGYITIHTGTYNGPIVAYGNAPLNWASSYTGTVYVHYNTGSGCGTASSCGTSTVSCITCSAPSAPANDLVCNAYAISCGQLLSATTVNATNSGTGENNACGVSQTMPGVWFKITGTGQIMTAYLCNTVWDSKISVFSGPNCSSLTCVGGNDDNGPSCLSLSASYQWTSVPGLNYYILVHGYSTNSSFQIGLICTTPPPPDPTSITASSNTICIGQPVTLTANGINGTVYWFAGGCGVGQIATGNSISVTPTSTTTYYARNFNSGLFSTNCVSTTVVVNPLPSVGAGPNQTICSGSGVSLNGSGATTYSWNNGVTNGVTFYPNGTQTYTVTGTNSNGCSNTASTTVTVVSAPMANAGQPETGVSTCGINQVQLAANTPQAGQTGTWMVFNGIGGSFSNVNSPTSTFTGNYGQSYTLQWTVTNGQCSTSYQKLVTFNQPNAASLGANIGPFDLLWGGLTSTDWATSTNWYEKQPAGHFVRMSGNAQPINSSQVFTLNQANGGICIGNTNPTLTTSGNAYDVFVNPGIILNLTNDSLHIYHDIVNNGTLTASNGTVSFVGSQNSSFIGTGTSQLLNMKVNKTGGATVTLNHPVVVTGNLNMIQGNIFTTPTNLLTLGSSSSNPGILTYNTGTIVGPFKRFFNNLPTNGIEGFFPVGTSTYNRYSNINFTSSPGVNQSLTVRYNTGAPIVNGSPLYNGLPLTVSNSLIQNYSIDGYWEVIPNGGNYSSTINSTPYNITFFANNLNGMTTPQICRIIKSPGSNHTSWQSCGTHVTIPQNANPQSFLISSNNTQGFSWFNIGSSNLQTLPIELLHFSGQPVDKSNLIYWSTATEHNTTHFVVEKSENGNTWFELATVAAAGNSTQELHYSITDNTVKPIYNYYRLTQYDTDGAYKIFDPIAINNKSSIRIVSRRTNLLGQDIDENATGVILEIYEDGTFKRIIK